MNVQTTTDPAGRLLWASSTLPGAVHDAKAARTHGTIDTPARAGVERRADKGYRGAGGTARLPSWGRWEALSAGQQARNRSHAKARALGEQAMAALKTWRLLRKLRCLTTRSPADQAISPPQHKMKEAHCDQYIRTATQGKDAVVREVDLE